LTLQSQHYCFPLAGLLGRGLCDDVEGDGTGDDAGEALGIGDDDIDGFAGDPLGGGMDGSDDLSEPATDTSPFPSSCGMSAIAVRSLIGSLGGWRCRLHFAGGAGGEGLVVIPAPLPAAPAAFFLAAARVRLLLAVAAAVLELLQLGWLLLLRLQLPHKMLQLLLWLLLRLYLLLLLGGWLLLWSLRLP
jgi:hypothetical protein